MARSTLAMTRKTGLSEIVLVPWVQYKTGLNSAAGRPSICVTRVVSENTTRHGFVP